MKKLINLEDPFFEPRWIRVAVVVVTAGWSVFELSQGSALWGVIFGGLSAICAWRFSTIDYTREPEE